MQINRAACIIFTAFTLISGCKLSDTSVSRGLSRDQLDDCPYQMLSYIGSSKIDRSKGIKALTSLESALELEKNQLVTTGKLEAKTRVEVGNYISEIGEFKVPISEENADSYVKLSNSICTIRKDIIDGIIFQSEAQKNEAVALYLNLLSLVIDEKKTLIQ